MTSRFGIEFNVAKFGLVCCVILQIYMCQRGFSLLCISHIYLRTSFQKGKLIDVPLLRYTAHGRDGAPDDPTFSESELLGVKQAVPRSGSGHGLHTT